MKKMKKMKKQFLSLFVLLCMIISMFPTTALAANIIDVSGNVTITRSDEELTCADNLYYGEVNVNGSATESKTRLTHPVLPLIQWQYGNNTYQIIPSAYKYYVYNINDPNHILEGIEGSEGSSTLSGWPGTYKCYQTVVTTDGVTNGTATFDIDLIYQFSRLNSSIGWTYASNWGGRTLHFTIKQTVAYTVLTQMELRTKKSLQMRYTKIFRQEWLPRHSVAEHRQEQGMYLKAGIQKSLQQ